MKTLISLVKVPSAQTTAIVGKAIVGTQESPMRAHIHIFDSRMYFKVIDVFAVINTEVDDPCRYNHIIQQLIRQSKHVTGTVLCTNVGVFADIIALKHLVNDWFIVNEGKTQQLYRIGDQGALLSLLDCDDNTGTGFDKAVAQLNPGWFKEIEQRKLFYYRNTPSEKAPDKKEEKKPETVTKAPKPTIEQVPEYSVVPAKEEVTVSILPEDTNTDESEKVKTPTSIEEALAAFISSIVSGKEVEFKFTVKVK